MNAFLNWSLTLRGRMLLASILVEVIMLSVLVGNSVRLIQESMEQLTNSRIVAIELAYKTAVIGPLAARDYATLRDILDGLRKAEDVLYLVVVDSNERILASSGLDHELSLPPPGRDLQGREINHVRFDVSLFGQHYGQVQYGLSTEYIQQARNALFTQGVLVAFAEISLTVILLSIVGYFLTRHLTSLIGASGRIANGDYNARLALTGNDEIAQLGKRFNLMADAIQNQIQALQESDLRSRSIADYTFGWESWVTPDGALRWVNPAVNRVTGYTPQECYQMAKYPFPIIYNDDYKLVEYCHQLGLEGKTGQDQEFRIKRKDGRVIWVAMSWQPIFDNKNESLGYRSSIRDISVEHRAREALKHQANHDDLTGLFNRRAFEAKLQDVLDGLRFGGMARCLLYIDLDQFKLVNDTCGHSAGDKLLQEITSIMQRTMGDGFLARLGGDEFGLIVDGDEEQGYRQASKLIDAIHAKQYIHEGHHFQLGASVGLVNVIDAQLNIDELLIAADQACYAAKDRGRNRIEIYRDSDDYFSNQRAQFLSVEEINVALSEERFVLYYQRINPLHEGLPDHAEILLRMKDGHGRIVTPDRFIPAAERFNLMTEIDRWVITNTCKRLKEIGTTQFQDTSFAINLSGLSLSSGDLTEFVVMQFDQYQIDPQRISFEITETAAMVTLEKAQDFIRAMHEIGVKVALDDFGTGLSSFAYLRKLEVDFLKIDAMFVRNLDNDERDFAVVKSIMEVANVYGMLTIAEFVHNQQIAKILKNAGVDYGQGFALHKPEPF